jgi:hypothetical protein
MASLHAITAIFAIPGRDLTPYMPEELSIDTWKKTYLSNFPLIDVSDLMMLPLSPIDGAGIVSARLSFSIRRSAQRRLGNQARVAACHDLNRVSHEESYPSSTVCS